jgi:hypothetical protein
MYQRRKNIRTGFWKPKQREQQKVSNKMLSSERINAIQMFDDVAEPSRMLVWNFWSVPTHPLRCSWSCRHISCTDMPVVKAGVSRQSAATCELQLLYHKTIMHKLRLALEDGPSTLRAQACPWCCLLGMNSPTPYRRPVSWTRSRKYSSSEEKRCCQSRGASERCLNNIVTSGWNHVRQRGSSLITICK